MAGIKELDYFEKIKDIISGNQASWAGVYDTKAQADEAAETWVRTVFGSTKPEDKAKKIEGGRVVSRIKGMNKVLMELHDYLKDLSIDDVAQAKKIMDDIIAQTSKTAIMRTVKKILKEKPVDEDKIPEDDTVPIVQDQTITDSVKNKIKGYIDYAKDKLKYVDFNTVLLRAGQVLGGMAIVDSLRANGLLQGFYGLMSGGNQRVHELTTSSACMVGFIPLQHIREIEVARSGQTLKFRATGSVFLAKQEGGGDDAVRISGKFYRDEVVVLLALLMLYEYGGSKIAKLDLTGIDIEKFNVTTIRENQRILAINKDKRIPSVEERPTFPFVSRHVIIPNVYIETLSFEEKIEDGINVIRYDVLLRTFNKQKVFKMWTTDDPNILYASTVYSEKLKFHRMFEFGINALWRYIQAEHLVLNTGYWKVGVTKSGIPGKPQARDVYYNIDVGDIVGTFAMGAMGFAGRAHASGELSGVYSAISNIISQFPPVGVIT